jgi:hypothetical protein
LFGGNIDHKIVLSLLIWHKIMHSSYFKRLMMLAIAIRNSSWPHCGFENQQTLQSSQIFILEISEKKFIEICLPEFTLDCSLLVLESTQFHTGTDKNNHSVKTTLKCGQVSMLLLQLDLIQMCTKIDFQAAFYRVTPMNYSSWAKMY